jgi:hypothetical protein
LHFAFCILHFAFCILHLCAFHISHFAYILHFAFCIKGYSVGHEGNCIKNGGPNPLAEYRCTTGTMIEGMEEALSGCSGNKDLTSNACISLGAFSFSGSWSSSLYTCGVVKGS